VTDGSQGVDPVSHIIIARLPTIVIPAEGEESRVKIGGVTNLYVIKKEYVHIPTSTFMYPLTRPTDFEDFGGFWRPALPSP